MKSYTNHLLVAPLLFLFWPTAFHACAFAPHPIIARQRNVATRRAWLNDKGSSRDCRSADATAAAATALRAQSEDESGGGAMPSSLSEADQTILGAGGICACLVTFWSEFVLKTTGCGLPAGPAGLLGAAEGVSYLAVVGVVVYSLVTKIRTGSGLPAGPGGVLGAAEGLSYLSIVAGLVVLGFQILDYGYVPNAVPMEGGMCS